jgi:hypothetical protein
MQNPLNKFIYLILIKHFLDITLLLLILPLMFTLHKFNAHLLIILCSMISINTVCNSLGLIFFKKINQHMYVNLISQFFIKNI